MESTPAFRVNAVVALVVRERNRPASSYAPHPAVERARSACARVGRTDPELRDVAQALLRAVLALEGDVERVRAGVELRDEDRTWRAELVSLGVDGVTVPRAGPFSPGDPVEVLLDLPLRDGPVAMRLPATVGVSAEDGHLEVAFDELHPTQREALVAFTFQQQAKERHRDLDRPVSAGPGGLAAAEPRGR